MVKGVDMSYMEKAETILFCENVVQAYDDGRIMEHFAELSGYGRPDVFLELGICFLLGRAGPGLAEELFKDFICSAGLDEWYPVAGEDEFEENSNLWADVEGHVQQSQHAARIDLLRWFIEWLREQL